MENLNAEQIIKALEHCVKDSTCEQCPQSPFTCHIQEDALALIKKLTKENAKLARSCTELERKCASEKADTVRKMQERLKNAFPSIAEAIDYFANEILGGEGK